MKNKKVDLEKIEKAVEMILEAIGEDKNREGLIETPKRVAKMYEEIFAGMNEDAAMHLEKTFTVDSRNIVVEKDIVFHSTCEHHLMPFFGVCHIAYIPNDKVAGLSKLARTVEVFARRPQIQEQLTEQIAKAIMDNLDAKGVAVYIEAEHMCMSMRGVKKPGTKTVTYATKGVFKEDINLLTNFFNIIK